MTWQGTGKRAYSLTELLVVMGIVSMLAALAVSAWNSIVASGQIAQAGNQVISSLSLATQRASADNRPVVVRIIKGTDGEYRELQVAEIKSDGGLSPLERIVRLPDSVAVASNQALSSIFSLAEKTAGPNDPPVRGQRSYKYQEIQFRPDGRLVLDVGKLWFLTVMPVRQGTSSTTPPANYATIQIDPVNGSLSLYRP